MSPFWLTDADRATLAEAVRITNARPAEHVTRDSCERCGGLGCDECRHCDCHACYRPEYTRESTKGWKP